MLEQAFLTINEWMSGGLLIAAAGCFLWGMVSVAFSPCHIASIPLIVGYVAGQERALKARDAAYYAVGAILIWVALDMWGVSHCSMSGSLMGRIKVKGLIGALVLGLAYGILSGSCTFGFIAPILAIITIQQKILIGIVYIVLFGIGHCIPIAVAGSSTATVRKLLENSSFHEGSQWFRKCAGAAIGLLGLYFVVRPFVDIS